VKGNAARMHAVKAYIGKFWHMMEISAQRHPFTSGEWTTHTHSKLGRPQSQCGRFDEQKKTLDAACDRTLDRPVHVATTETKLSTLRRRVLFDGTYCIHPQGHAVQGHDTVTLSTF
jgi:hypothetical protein